MDKKAKAPVDRSEEILQTGKWPSGLPVTEQERRVIEHNRAHTNIEWVKGTAEPTEKK